MIHPETGLEVKDQAGLGAGVRELKDLIEAQARGFERFKDAHATELKELKSGRSDPLTHQTVEKTATELVRLAGAVDALETRINRPTLKGKAVAAEDKAYRSAFDTFVRKGERGLASGDLGLLEAKALTIGNGPDGGYAVPESIDADIETQMADISPMRTICRVVSVSSERYTKLVNTGNLASNWVDEATAARPETTSPTLAKVEPPMGEIYAFPFATQRALDDMMFDVERFLFEDIALEFAEREGDAFINGTGSNQPNGILNRTFSASADGSRTFGQIQEIATGVSADFPTSDPSDVLIDLKASLRQIYRPNAQFLLNSTTLAQILKFKDANGQYLWQPQMAYGEQATLWGSAYTIAEDMPDIGVDAHAVLYGDFMRAYTIVDRVGTRILRDPFTSKPHVGFYATKRVGGDLVNDEAVKALKFGV